MGEKLHKDRKRSAKWSTARKVRVQQITAKKQPTHYRPGEDLIAAQHVVDAMAGKQKSNLAGWVHGWVGAWLGR